MKYARKKILKTDRLFLHRLSFKLADGSSIKFHLIVNDDLDGSHVHPWDFTSFMLIGSYKEVLTDGSVRKNRPLTLVRHRAEERHEVLLYRLFGRRIPCLTVGRYGVKRQRWCEREGTLCDFCKPNHECADVAYWRDRR